MHKTIEGWLACTKIRGSLGYAAPSPHDQLNAWQLIGYQWNLTNRRGRGRPGWSKLKDMRLSAKWKWPL